MILLFTINLWHNSKEYIALFKVCKTQQPCGFIYYLYLMYDICSMQNTVHKEGEIIVLGKNGYWYLHIFPIFSDVNII